MLPDDLARYRRIGDDAPIDPDTVRDRRRRAHEHVDSVFLRAVQLVRDRVLVEDPGDCDGLAANIPADRIDVATQNARAVAAGRREASFRELNERELKQQRVGDHRRRHALELPRLALRRRFAGPEQLRRPTFGFTLTGGKGVGGGVNKVVARMPWAVRFGVDIFHTSQEAWDARFVSHSTRVRTVTVNAGNVGTTEFNLPATAQDMLIRTDATQRSGSSTRSISPTTRTPTTGRSTTPPRSAAEHVETPQLVEAAA